MFGNRLAGKVRKWKGRSVAMDRKKAAKLQNTSVKQCGIRKSVRAKSNTRRPEDRATNRIFQKVVEETESRQIYKPVTKTRLSVGK